jgi:hypothetical protein
VREARKTRLGESGVGNGNRTRNRRSHSPVLCQLSYSHRHVDYSNCCFRRCEIQQESMRRDVRLRK